MTGSTFGRALLVFAATLLGASSPVMAAASKADASDKARAEAAAKAEAEKARAEAAEKAEAARQKSHAKAGHKAESERQRDDDKAKRADGKADRKADSKADSKADRAKRAKIDDERRDRDSKGHTAEKRPDNPDRTASVEPAVAAPKPYAAATPPQQWAIGNAAMPKSITVIGQAGAPDAGPPAGQSLLVSFDAPNSAGVTEFSSGTVITAAGSIGGVRAAPAGNGSVYRSLGADSQSTFDFSGWTKGAPLASFSFEWGSIDSYNFVDFLNRRGETVWTLAGSDFPQFNGDQAAAITNQRLLVSFQREADIAAVRMRSKGAAFEFDRLAGAAATGAVPEPASWLMMIIGFGFVGHGLRRKRSRAIAA